MSGKIADSLSETGSFPATTVYVVDDDQSFLVAVERLLIAGGFNVKTFSSATKFLQASPADAPGCAILDVKMPGLSGLELQQALATLGSSLPLIFLTGHGDIPDSVQAIRNGAEDFLTKPVKREQLFAAIRRALARDAKQREQQVRQRSLQARFDTLTPRELEVLVHLMKGQLNKQIADDLGTSERTIKAHRANIMAKVQVQSMAELARLAEQAGL